MSGIFGGDVSTLITSVGTNTDAPTDPSVASGTLFSKNRGEGDNLDTLITNTTKPAADSTANVIMADVVGSKDDAAQTTVAGTRSILAYVKGLLNNTNKPGADSTTNVALADVVGSKDDAQQQTVTTTRSLMGYLKGLLTIANNLLFVPAADATANTGVNDACGNKLDAAQTSVGTTRSIMGYAKGLLTITTHSLAEIGDADYTSGNTGAFSAYQQIIASTAAATEMVSVTGTVLPGSAASEDVTIELAWGAAASEVVFARARITTFPLTNQPVSFTIVSIKQQVASARLSTRAKTDGASGAPIRFSVTLSQRG